MVISILFRIFVKQTWNMKSKMYGNKNKIIHRAKGGRPSALEVPAFISGKDDLTAVSTIISVHKYCITDSTVRKLFFRDRKAVYADECGDTGNEMIREFGISSPEHGEYLREDDDPIWNIRLIDETHPRYDAKLAKNGKLSGNMFAMMEKLFK